MGKNTHPAHTAHPAALTFLQSVGHAKAVVKYGRGEVVFSQGDGSNSVMYIQHGAVKLSILSKAGREAIVAVLGTGDFFGEGCLAGQPVRIESAMAITPCTLLVIDKAQMATVLHEQHAVSDRFISHMLSRHLRIEQDLIEQLFNSAEKRLAQALLRLARYGQPGTPRRLVPNLTQDTLSGMAGTTRSRVSVFMKRFKRAGFVDYSDTTAGIRINSTLLRVVLRD
jgi:CRP-like cAMP-binding protein